MNIHRLSCFPLNGWLILGMYWLTVCRTHTYTFIKYWKCRLYAATYAQAQARVNGNLHSIVRMYMLFISSRSRLLNTGVNYEFNITISYAARFIHKEETLHSTRGAVIHMSSLTDSYMLAKRVLFRSIGYFILNNFRFNYYLWSKKKKSHSYSYCHCS